MMKGGVPPLPTKVVAEQPSSNKPVEDKEDLDVTHGNSKRGFFRRWTTTSHSKKSGFFFSQKGDLLSTAGVDGNNEATGSTGRWTKSSNSSEHTIKTSNKNSSRSKNKWRLKPSIRSTTKGGGGGDDDPPLNGTPNLKGDNSNPRSLSSSSEQSNDSPIGVDNFPPAIASNVVAAGEGAAAHDHNDDDDDSQATPNISNYFHGKSGVTPLPFALRERGKAPEVTRTTATTATSSSTKKKKKKKKKYNPNLPNQDRYSPSTTTPTTTTSTSSPTPLQEQETTNDDHEERLLRRQTQTQPPPKPPSTQFFQPRRGYPPLPMNVIVPSSSSCPPLGLGQEEEQEQNNRSWSTVPSSFQPYSSSPCQQELSQVEHDVGTSPPGVAPVLNTPVGSSKEDNFCLAESAVNVATLPTATADGNEDQQSINNNPTTVIDSLQEEEEFYERAFAMVRGGKIIPQYVKDYDPHDYDHMRSLSPPTIDTRLRWQSSTANSNSFSPVHAHGGGFDEERSVGDDNDSRFGDSTIDTRRSIKNDYLDGQCHEITHNYTDDHDYATLGGDTLGDDDGEGSRSTLISRMLYSVHTIMSKTLNKKIPDDPDEPVFIPIQGDDLKVPLRRCQEVSKALENEYYDTPQCGGCQRELAVIADAAFLFCPICRQISPLFGTIKSIGGGNNKSEEEPEYLRFGLGLGMTQETMKKVYAEMYPPSASTTNDRSSTTATAYTTAEDTTREKEEI